MVTSGHNGYYIYTYINVLYCMCLLLELQQIFQYYIAGRFGGGGKSLANLVNHSPNYNHPNFTYNYQDFARGGKMRYNGKLAG